MGQVLHGSATPTEAIHRAIQVGDCPDRAVNNSSPRTISAVARSAPEHYALPMAQIFWPLDR